MKILRRFRDWLRDGKGWLPYLATWAFVWVMVIDFAVGYAEDIRDRRRHA